MKKSNRFPPAGFGTTNSDLSLPVRSPNLCCFPFQNVVGLVELYMLSFTPRPWLNVSLYAGVPLQFNPCVDYVELVLWAGLVTHGHGFAGELCSSSPLGCTHHLPGAACAHVTRSPVVGSTNAEPKFVGLNWRLASFDALIVTK